jgi:hypothetical protein
LNNGKALSKIEQAVRFNLYAYQWRYKNWDNQQAKAFVQKQTRKPTVTCDDFMMPYCALVSQKLLTCKVNVPLE